MSKPPEHAANFLKNLRSIYVGHLGLQSVTYRVETPCTTYIYFLWFDNSFESADFKEKFGGRGVMCCHSRALRFEEPLE